MCGIFAYIGKREKAAEFVLDGLKRLEYRGYDSWGIAVKSDKVLKSEKHTGKIGDANTILPESTIGIGHTRWATHGGVTDANAHPHLDCHRRIALVHNGIVENSEELKEKYLSEGHNLLSETDTEIIVHLIENHVAEGNDFKTAVRKTFRTLDGLNALVAIDIETNEIVAIKNGSPLIAGIGENEFFAASDASAIIPHTKKLLFIEDNQMAVLNSEVALYDADTGKPINTVITKVDWKVEETNMGEFKHYLEKEINEQPHILENISLTYKDQAKELASVIKAARGTFMVGCGTASYAALAGTYLFSKIAHHHVNFSVGSEFEYIEDYLNENSLVIPISQSGETIDIIDPVTKAKKRKAKIAAIVNVLGSTLYRIADHKYLLGVGVEKAVISTKAFSAMYAMLLLTAYTLAGKADHGRELLLKAGEAVKDVISNSDEIKKVAAKLKDAEHIFIIGRGLSYVTALEAALKLKETSYIHAEAFAGGELKHGVIALIEKGTPCIVIAPNDKTYDEIISNAQQIKSRGGFIIGIGPKKASVFDMHLPTHDIEEATLLPQVANVQLLSYYLALARGNKDPDKPRNLAKSVTVK